MVRVFSTGEREMSDGYKSDSGKWGLILMIAVIGAAGAAAINYMGEDKQEAPAAQAPQTPNLTETAPLR